jgi:selenocysteine-specific elongation factor
MKSIIVGTAGHIDHGKTALVRALTGIDADRLPEEKRRGITIDIGFADLDLGDVRVGFVDVPGHERFVKNMLAGAHGIDVVALVIAADESVMPQTREHFDICRLLRVSQGLIVLTKKDLVDDELLQLARAEAEDLVKGSFLEGAPIVSVSSRTGEGIEELKDALRGIGNQVTARSGDFITRLPIDRAFTMKGFGAVVTGTLTAGEIHEADELDLLPAAIRVRVRGLQVHGSSVKVATAGQRTAINLGGIEAAAIERGMMLVAVGRLQPTQAIDAQVQLLDDAPRALRSRQRLRVHSGAAEILARVRVLDVGGEIAPGKQGLVQLRFESPIVGVLGDRFIVRSYSPQTTIGGGEILDPFAEKHRARDFSTIRSALQVLSEGNRTDELTQFVVSAGKHGLSFEEVAARTAWRDEVIDEAIAEVTKSGRITKIEKNLFSSNALDDLKQQIGDAISAHHKREPLSRGLPKEVLRERFFAGTSPDLFRALISEFEKAGGFIAEKDIVRIRDHRLELSDEDARLRNSLNETYQKAGLAPPTLAEALSQAGVKPSAQHGRRIFQLLVDSGSLVKVHGDMYFHRDALEDLIKELGTFATTKPDRAIVVAEFKSLTGVSRKYAIPLLEHLDRLHVTRREGDRRVIS